MAETLFINLRSLLINAAGVRREVVDGRTYVVAHAASINPGVLPGSRGPLYYPPEECARNVRAWDGMPVTVGHPTDPITNEPLPAQFPGVWARQGIGRIRNSVFNGKLRHEVWLDEARTLKIAPTIISNLNEGRPVELSTGLYTDNEEAPEGSHFNGRPYTHIARNHRPDHLAILPGQKGACSVSDGCGLGVTNELVCNTHPQPDPQCPT